LLFDALLVLLVIVFDLVWRRPSWTERLVSAPISLRLAGALCLVGLFVLLANFNGQNFIYFQF
jgi:hypothetical protein